MIDRESFRQDMLLLAHYTLSDTRNAALSFALFQKPGLSFVQESLCHMHLGKEICYGLQRLTFILVSPEEMFHSMIDIIVIVPLSQNTNGLQWNEVNTEKGNLVI